MRNETENENENVARRSAASFIHFSILGDSKCVTPNVTDVGRLLMMMTMRAERCYCGC